MNLDPWHIVGLAGTALFSGRWALQAWRSHTAGRPVVTRDFWYISVAGSALLLAYFIFGKPDAVGVISNAFPLALALYNLSLPKNDTDRSPNRSSLPDR
jgi:lipid-A-disaccharide synthase-like uncharacterized protein